MELDDEKDVPHTIPQVQRGHSPPVTYVEFHDPAVISKTALKTVKEEFPDHEILSFKGIPSGGYRLTTDRPLLELTPATSHNGIFYMIEGDTYVPNAKVTAELIFFHDDLVTLHDVLSADVLGAYKIRKWRPSSVTKKPNSGYSIYFYSKRLAGLALKTERFMIKDQYCRLRPSIPPRTAPEKREAVRRVVAQSLFEEAHALSLTETMLLPNIAELIRAREFPDQINLAKHVEVYAQQSTKQVENLKIDFDAQFAELDRRLVAAESSVRSHETRLVSVETEIEKISRAMESNHSDVLSQFTMIAGLIQQDKHSDKYSSDYKHEGSDHATPSVADYMDVEVKTDTNQAPPDLVKSLHEHTLDGKVGVIVATTTHGAFPVIMKRGATYAELEDAIHVKIGGEKGRLYLNGAAIPRQQEVSHFSGEMLSYELGLIGGTTGNDQHPDTHRKFRNFTSDQLQKMAQTSSRTIFINGIPLRKTSDVAYYKSLASLKVTSLSYEAPLIGGSLRQTTLTEAWGSTVSEEDNNERKEEPVSSIAGRPFRIIQWNAYHLTDSKVADILSTADDLDVDAILISETQSPDSIRSLPRIGGFNNPESFKPSGSKGVAAYFRDGVEYDVISQETIDNSHQALVQLLNVKLADQILQIRHAYVHPDAPVQLRTSSWKKLLSPHNGPLLVCGDMNEHSELWDRAAANNTTAIDRLWDDETFSVLNNGSPTRIWFKDEQLRTSTVDVAIANNALTDIGAQWEVMYDFSSDHLPCLITISTGVSSKQQKVVRQILDYQSYRNEFWSRLQSCTAAPSLRFIQVLAEMQSTLPTIQTSHDPCPWWDQELLSLKRQRNRARRKGNGVQYAELRRKFKTLYRQKKKFYFDQQVSNIVLGHNPWKVAKRMFPKVLPKSRSTITGSPVKISRIANSLLDTYATTMTAPSPIMEEEHKWLLEKDDKVSIDRWELTTVLCKSNKNSAAGRDGITYHHIARICEDIRILDSLVETMNIWSKSGIPEVLKTAKIIPIPKNLDNSAFRPISLLSCLSKLLERIVERQIQREHPDIIPVIQNGCRRGSTAADCVSILGHVSTRAARSGRLFGVVFLDFSKAYDRVSHSILLEKAHALGIASRFLWFINDWLSNRSIYVTVGNHETECRSISRGLPQGSSLSVLLWKIYVADFPLNDEEATMFMDDTAYWASGRTLEELENALQAQTRLVENWCYDSDLKINLTKTVLMTNDALENPHIELNSALLAQANRTKYLGFTLFCLPGDDQHINFDLRPIGRDLKRRASLLRFVPHSLPSQFVYQFARALMMGKIRYYLPALSAESDEILAPLNTGLNHLMRTLSGGLKTTPIPLLRAQTRIPSLRSLILEANASVLKRTLKFPDLQLAKLFREWDGQHYDCSPLRGIDEVLHEIPAAIRDRGFSTTVSIPAKTQMILHEIIFHNDLNRETYCTALIPLDSHNVELWTDGSYICTDTTHSAGAGIALKLKSNAKVRRYAAKVLPATSSYIAELAALIVGAERLVELLTDWGSPPWTIGIYSDSKSVISHLEKVITHDIGVDHDTSRLLHLLADIQKACRAVEIYWVPGHANVGLNPMADELAEMGHTSATYAIMTQPYAIVKEKIRHTVETYTRGEIEHYIEQRPYGQFAPESFLRSSFLDVGPVLFDKLPHRDNTSIFRIRTGHCATASYLKLLKVIESDECRICKTTPETLKHLLFECSRMSTADSPIKTMRQALTWNLLCEGVEQADRDVLLMLSNAARFLRRKGINL